MSTPLHHESRKEFQLERMILFSDAVFAIAITLLVIEIKVPGLDKEINEKAILLALERLIPKFIGFLLSFFLIGLYWTIHHRMFGFLIAYTDRLMWLNLLFLLSIVFMPFSTAFYSEYSKPDTIHLLTPLIFYVGNIWFTGLMNYKLWGYLGNPANKVAAGIPSELFVSHARIRSLMVPLVFSLAIPVALVQPYVARYVPLLIPFVMKMVQIRFKKKGLIQTN